MLRTIFRPFCNALTTHQRVRFQSTITTTTVNLDAGKKLSAFTGKPSFYEALFFLDDILSRLTSLPRPCSITSCESIKWHDKDYLSDSLGFALSNLQYRKIREKLVKLAGYSHIPEIRQFLQPNFAHELTGGETEINEAETAEKTEIVQRSYYGRIDMDGKAVAVGKRKSSSAKVMLVPGTGELWVNGKPMVEYFKRWVDRFKLAEPLRVTSGLGKWNIWALVRGGGPTGYFIGIYDRYNLFG